MLYSALPAKPLESGMPISPASEPTCKGAETISPCTNSSDTKADAREKCHICPHAITWSWSQFEDLQAQQLYAVLRLRQEIFIVEQGVPYADIDDRDAQSLHLLGLLNKKVVAYLRALPPDLFAPGYASFGRVVVTHKMRGRGLGRLLVEKYFDRFENENSDIPIKISSQAYLKDFYASFGFVAVGAPYIEDRIPHIAMIKQIKSAK